MIDAGGPAIHLQPIVDFAANRVAGFEALARFDGGPPTPDRWFVRAHQVGLGIDLEVAALRAALARRSDLAPHQFLALNLSPMAFSTPSVQDVLRDEAPLHGVVIELTEHDPLSDRNDLAEAFAMARRLGALVAVEDIGTGYEALEWLLSVRPEMVKLDRAFIHNIDTDEARALFVRFIGDLVDKLDAWLVAEGIETDGELEAIVRMGVPLGQGFRLGRPGPEPTAADPDVTVRTARFRRLFESPITDVAAHIELVPAIDDIDRRPWTAPRVVLVDQLGQPVAVLDGNDQAASSSMPLCVKADDELRAVAMRALARSSIERWSPVVVTDDRGRYQGIIRMERLVRALSEQRNDRP